MSTFASSRPPAPPAPVGRVAADRQAVLAAIMAPDELPTLPPIALQVIHATSRRNCQPTEVVELLAQDPALCAKLLRAANSCVFGLSKPVSSLDGAVYVLGLNPLRSLVLGLSLPAIQAGAGVDAATREHWLASVSGALFARELAVRLRAPHPEDDLVAGLLRDLGGLLLRRAFPDRWQAVADRLPGAAPDRLAEAEYLEFGIDHAEVSADLLRAWKLPDELVLPILHHHFPGRAAPHGRAVADRAELLHFVEQLVHLDAVADDPAGLSRLLAHARDRYGLSQAELIEFLQAFAPRVNEFADLLFVDIAAYPDFARILSAGAETLVGLTVEASRHRLLGATPAPEPTPAAPPAPANNAGATVRETAAVVPLPPAPKAGATVREVPAADSSFVTRLNRRADSRPPAGLPAGLADHPRYAVLGTVGAGGMGTVYRAEHKIMGRVVALKVISSEWVADTDAIDRFRREVRLAARLSHPNIVTAYDADEVDGFQCLVMEYIVGLRLDQLVARDGRLPVAAACRLIAQAADGLEHAVTRGMVHRDIKPQNLMVTPDGRLKILDFGLARLVEADAGAEDHGRTAPRRCLGTPDYFAPEQAHDSATADHRADVYALGCTLHFLLAGRPPFEGTTALAKALAHANSPPPALADVRADVPPGLQAVVWRMMAKRPDDRYQSHAAVAADLHPFTTDGPGATADPGTANGHPPAATPSRFLLGWVGSAFRGRRGRDSRTDRQ